MSSEEAAQIALELYGLSGNAKRLNGEMDLNFLFETQDGKILILKIAHEEAIEHELDFQNQALSFLASQKSRLKGDFPLLVSGREGKALHSAEWGSSRRWVRILTHVPGTFLKDIETHSEFLLESLGSLLAQMTLVLAEFSHPQMERELKWDLRFAEQVLDREMPWVDDPDSLQLLKKYRKRFSTSFKEYFPRLPYSVIHNDANPDNILVNAETHEIIGLIDFGDLVYSFSVCELAIALAYVMLDKPKSKIEPMKAGAAVIRAYEKVRPLEDAEKAVLFDLVCARLCVSVSISAHNRKINPENSYLNTSEKSAWQLLRKLENESGWQF